MTPSFVHLRLHSEFDVRKGAARLSGDDSVVARAAALGQPALALTDSGCLFGAVKFYESCRRHGVKPVIGCEIRVDDKHDHNLLLLCADNGGYVNLSRLLSRAYEDGGWVRPHWLTPQTTAGIIALSGGRRGDIGALVSRGRQDGALRAAREWAARFPPDNFYLEVWRAGGGDDTLAPAVAEIGRIAGLPVVATHPVQCTRAGDGEILDVRLCIAHGRQVADERRERALAEQPHLLDADDMRARFADLPGAADNAVEIAKRCNFEFSFGSAHLPSLADSMGEDAPAALLRLARAGLEKKLPADAPAAMRKEYDERLLYETNTIAAMGFADYFLIVMDFIGWAKRENIPVGPGRGSGAGSLAAYALDITTLDPIRHGLLFERFLNPDRVSMPDFDVDFCVDGRDRVIAYVAEKYGEKQVSQIVTFGSIGARGAVRDVGRVLGFSYGYCDRIARLVPDGVNVSLTSALAQSGELAEAQKDEDGGRLINLALQVEGLPRNIGTHAGGVLITPKPLEEYCPRYVAADTQTLVSQLDMVDLEKIGLVKFDFLGLRTLTILHNAERNLRDSGAVGADFSLENIPLDDAETYALFQKAETIGIFQCESAGMRDLMRRLRPDRFEDIVALMALFRPGPLASGDSDLYIRRKHAERRGEWEGEINPAVRATLSETYGVFVYQEQVMEAARQLAGYSLGEADLLRRAMGKKKEDEMMAQRARFISGAKEKNNTPAGEANALFDKIAGFAGYGFNKSHAAAYALLSYRTAYLKAHYPAVFLAAVLSAEAGSSEQVRLILSYARRLGIAARGPDINAGMRDFRADGDCIVYGLAAIKGLGDGAIAEIIKTRGDKPFRDLFDFCARMKDGQLSAGMAEALVFAGAFDRLHDNRAAVRATLPSALSRGDGGALFDFGGGLADAKAWDQRQTLIYERQVLGFSLSGSFYRLYENILRDLPLTHRSLSEVAVKGERVCVAGLFRRTLATSKMRANKFGLVIIADDNGELEARAGAEMLRPLRDATAGEDLLIIEGEARLNHRDDLAVRAASVLTLDAFFQRRLKRLIIVCGDDLSAAALRKTLPPEARGKSEIILRYEGAELSCDILLAEKRAIDRLFYERAAALPGVKRVKPEFA